MRHFAYLLALLYSSTLHSGLANGEILTIKK